MQAGAVVVTKIPRDPAAGFGVGGIGPQIDLLVFDGPPSPFDEIGRGELAALIGVEDLGCLGQRLLRSFYAKTCLQRNRRLACEDTPGEPGRGGRHRCNRSRDSCGDPTTTGATDMRVTAILTQTERKRQDGPVRAAAATAGTARGGKRLILG